MACAESLDVRKAAIRRSEGISGENQGNAQIGLGQGVCADLQDNSDKPLTRL
jgi:hypothetical protein